MTAHGPAVSSATLNIREAHDFSLSLPGKEGNHVVCLLGDLSQQNPLRVTQLIFTPAGLPQEGLISLSKYIAVVFHSFHYCYYAAVSSSQHSLVNRGRQWARTTKHSSKLICVGCRQLPSYFYSLSLSLSLSICLKSTGTILSCGYTTTVLLCSGPTA